MSCPSFVKVFLQSDFVAIDDASFEPLLHRSSNRRDGSGLSGLPGGIREQLGQRVIRHRSIVPFPFKATFIEHQLPTDLASAFVKLEERDDLRCVDDGHIQAGLNSVVQKHGVQGGADVRRKPEGNIADAQDGMDAGKLALDAANRLNGISTRSPELFLARPERECESVKNEVVRL